MPKPALKRMKMKGGEGFAFSLISSVQHLRAALEVAPSVSITELAQTLQHSNAADFHRIKLHKRVTTDDEAKAWLIRKAASEIKGGLVIDGDTVTLKEGVTVDDLRFDRKPIAPLGLDDSHYLQGLFDAMRTTGTFAKSLRANGQDLDELRESMRLFGWLDHHPAILDENGVVIVGHRRLAVAKELGIEPKTITVEFGRGDLADAERLRLASGSNVGNKPLNTADRRHIAKRVYGGEWSLEALWKAIEEARTNVRDDVAKVKVRKRTEGRGSTPQGAQMVKAQEAIKALMERGEKLTVRKITELANVGETTAKRELGKVRHLDAALAALSGTGS